MNAEEFKKILLDSLNNLTTTEIKRIRSKYNAEGDYGVNEDGSSYWIPPKAAFNVKFQEGFSDIDLISNKLPILINNVRITVGNDKNKNNLKVNDEKLENEVVPNKLITTSMAA